MNARKTIMLLAAVLAIAVAAWFIPAVLKAEKAAKFSSNFEKIHDAKPPLSTTQVEQIMGQPLRIEHAETTGITGDVYHYPTYPPGGDFQVIIVNGAVFSTALPSYTPKS